MCSRGMLGVRNYDRLNGVNTTACYKSRDLEAYGIFVVTEDAFVELQDTETERDTEGTSRVSLYTRASRLLPYFSPTVFQIIVKWKTENH